MELKDVEKLAKLARIEINNEEKKELLRDLQAILDYVDQIKQAPPSAGHEELVMKNVFREDLEPHQTGIYTEKLLAEAPESQDGYIKVKKIL